MNYGSWLADNFSNVLAVADPIGGWPILAAEALQQVVLDALAADQEGAPAADIANKMTAQTLDLVSAGKLTGDQALKFIDGQIALAKAQDKSFLNEIAGILEAGGHAAAGVGGGLKSAGIGVLGLALAGGGLWWMFGRPGPR